MTFGNDLRQARLAAGLTQSQLANLAATSQARVSSYESGTVTPGADTRRRLLDAVRPRPSTLLHRHRAKVRHLAETHGLSDVRVFGSVARGDDGPGSDVDLLVTPGPDTSLLDMAAFAVEVEDLLGRHVDVLSDRGLDTESSISSDAEAV